MKLTEINFSELDYREIGLWEFPLKAAILVGVSLLTLFLSYQFIIQPKLDMLDKQYQQDKDKRKEFQEKYSLSANLEAYQDQMVEIKESYKKLLRQLPTSDQLPELIDTISRQAVSNGLKYQSITPGKIETVSAFYNELPLKLVVEGTYNGFGNFVSDLSTLPRIITLHDFEIKHQANNNAKDTQSNNKLVMNIDAKTYWLATLTTAETNNTPSTDKSPANANDKALNNNAPGALAPKPNPVGAE